VQKILFVALGGAAGSVLRYLCITLFPAVTPNGFPWPVFVVNITGCFIAGLLTRFWVNGQPGTDLSLLLLTGFLGGFTTYSAFSTDTLNLFRNQQVITAFIYATGTVVAAIFSAAAGFWLCGIFLRFLR
jgi:fluoride exporter